MKREKYFRDEPQHMFISYAIVLAMTFTLLCGLFFMAVLPHGRKSITEENSTYVAAQLEQILKRYKDGIEQLSARPEMFGETMDTRSRAGVLEESYGIINNLDVKGDLFVTDRDRNILLSNRGDRLTYLDVPEGMSWGIFWYMDSRPGQTVVKLVEGQRSQQNTIALGRSVERERQTVGYVVCAIPGSQIQQILDRLETQTTITDSCGWVSIGSNYNLISKSNQALGVLERAGHYPSYDKQMYLVSDSQVYHRLFNVYSISDMQNIVIPLSLSSMLVVTALTMVTLWMLFRAKEVTETKAEDFHRILDMMGNARSDDLESSIQIDSDNEFHIAVDTFNEAIGSLKLQMENNRKMTRLVTMAQNRRLESQFNPHFLYNTSENIRYMCKLGPITAERMVSPLSNLPCYSLDGSRDRVTLKKDMEHPENYLTILGRRPSPRLGLQAEIEPEAMECRIPKLVLQPMIESSVKYGFGSQLNLKVGIKVYIHKGKLMMTCRDDGMGIPQETSSELNAALKQKENTSRHSGFYSIHRRITILYGRPYGVETRSTEGHGATLAAALPMVQEEMQSQMQYPGALYQALQDEQEEETCYAS